MSAELDDRVDAARAKLISLAGQQIGMGNYKQIMREYQKLMLDVINILDDVNEQADTIGPAQMAALKGQAADALAKSEAEGEEGAT